MAVERCWSCGEGDVVTDPDTGARVCCSCGREHDPGAVFTHQESFGPDGRPDRSASSLVHSVGDPLAYRARKLRSASDVFSSVALRLDFPPSRYADAFRLALDATSGELASASSAFLPALSAACCYLVARLHRHPVSLAEAAAAAPCAPRSLADLAARVARHLALPPLPGFDAAAALERAVKSSPSLSAAAAAAYRTDDILSLGLFLLQCATKWSLTTGRHPLPMVAAVATFAAEVNGITSISVDDIAKEIYAVASTSRQRLRELTETLVRVARALLPWGADVTAKNLVQNVPLLIRLMEMRSKSKQSDGFLEGLVPNPQDLLNNYPHSAKDEELEYFQVDADKGDEKDVNTHREQNLSLDCISNAYGNALERLRCLKDAGELGKDTGAAKLRGGLDLEAWIDNLEGRRDLGGTMTFEQILSRDVGYDTPPPSFVAGEQSRSQRRAKIEAAKDRIDKIRNSSHVAEDMIVIKNDSLREKAVNGKRKRRKRGAIDILRDNSLLEMAVKRKRRRNQGAVGGGIDWEDCIIELLLLHGVDETEIEQGQYRRLVDLHVFS